MADVVPSPVEAPLSRQPLRSSSLPPSASLGPSTSATSPPLRARPAPPQRTFSPPPADSPSRSKSLLSRLRRSSTAGEIPAPTPPRPKRASALQLSSPRTGILLGEPRVLRQGSIPTIPIVQEKEEEAEVDWEADWERVRTLPRVRLIPPEGDPVTLYPMPQPRVPLPYLEGAFSKPSLLSTSLAASLISHASLPAPTIESEPPPPLLSNRRGAAVVPAGTEHQWKSMAEGFVLPPPMFSRHGLPAAGRRVVMPKTRRQVEADIGRRVSMVMTHERNRGSLEIKREDIIFIQQRMPGGARPQSPPICFSPQENDILPRPATPTPTSSIDPGVKESDSLPWDQEGVLAIDGFPPMSEHSTGDESDMICDEHEQPDDDVMDADESEEPSDAPPLFTFTPLNREAPATKPPTPIATMTDSPIVFEEPSKVDDSPILKATPSSPPRESPPIIAAASAEMERQSSEEEQPRRKRRKSLSSALAWSFKGPSTVPAPPLPDLPAASQKTIRKQKSLKQIFFSDSQAPPPVPSLPVASAEDSTGPTAGSSSANLQTRKSKGLLSRASTKPTAKKEDAPSASASTAAAETSGASDSRPGLIKRFSLSNMSSAFRRKSLSNPNDFGIPIPAEPVPQVPTIPTQYRGPKKGKSASTPVEAVVGQRSEAPPLPLVKSEGEANGSQETKGEAERPVVRKMPLADTPHPQPVRRKSHEMVIDLRNFSKNVYRRSSEPGPSVPTATSANDLPPPPPPPPALPVQDKRKAPELVIDLRQSARSPPTFMPPPLTTSPASPNPSAHKGLLPAAQIIERSGPRNVRGASMLPPSPKARAADLAEMNSPEGCISIASITTLDDEDEDEGEPTIMEATHAHLARSSSRPSDLSLSTFLRNPGVSFESLRDTISPVTAPVLIPLPVSPTVMIPSLPLACHIPSAEGSHRASPVSEGRADPARSSIDSLPSSSSSVSDDPPPPSTPSILGLSNIPSPSPPTHITIRRSTRDFALDQSLCEGGGVVAPQGDLKDDSSIVIVSPVTSPIKSPAKMPTPSGGARGSIARFSPDVISRWRKATGSKRASAGELSARNIPLPTTPEGQGVRPLDGGEGRGGSLQADVQLSSLHFEGLGLDFELEERGQVVDD